jgi:hypothetical protein
MGANIGNSDEYYTLNWSEELEKFKKYAKSQSN